MRSYQVQKVVICQTVWDQAVDTTVTERAQNSQRMASLARRDPRRCWGEPSQALVDPSNLPLLFQSNNQIPEMFKSVTQYQPTNKCNKIGKAGKNMCLQVPTVKS